MRRHEVQFTTLGGEQSVTFFEPLDRPPRAVVLVAPALGVRASYYRKLCEGLATKRIASAAVDLPGSGESPIRASRQHDWGYEELVAHFRAAIQMARRQYPSTSVHVLGHSIGGQIALLLGGEPAPLIDSVVLVASGSPYWRAWSGLGAIRVRVMTALCAIIADQLGYFPGSRLGFGGREARSFMRQWARVAKTGQYRLGTFEGEARLAAAGPPTLAIALSGDPMAPRAAICATLDKLTARDVTLERWAHPPHGGDHNRWPSRPDFVVERVERFIERDLPSRAVPEMH